MIDEDPVLIIRDVISDNIDVANLPMASLPRIHTGWYDYGSSSPQITVTNTDEFVSGGGETGHTAGTGAGGVAQVRVGTAQVNCWAGTREDLRGAAPDGSDVNPKDAAYRMATEVHRVLQENADGTLDDSGNRQLNSLGADSVQRIVETDSEAPVVYRYEVTAKYTYVSKTE